MTNEEYMEEVLEIKGQRLKKFETLMNNGFEIINSKYGFKAYVSECLELYVSGHERICIIYNQIVFDKGTVVIPFEGNAYYVGVDKDDRIEGKSLDHYSLDKYLQVLGFEKEFDSNGSRYSKGSLAIKTQARSLNLIIISKDLLIEVPIRNLTLADTGLYAKVVNTCIKIV